MKSIRRVITGVVAAASVLAASTSVWAADELVLGYAMARSGPFASTGLSSEVAVDLAVAEINRAGGVNGKSLRVVKFDTAGEPDQAVVAIRRFSQDENALAVIGPFLSSECRVAFPVGERAGITMMSSAASAPGLSEPFSFAFRNTMDEGVKFEKLMRYLQEEGELGTTAAVAFATDDFVSKSAGSESFPAQLEAYGIEVTQSVSFPFAAFDLSPQVSQLMASPPDMVALAAPPEAAAKFVRELRRQGYAGRVIGSSIFATPEFPGRVAEAGDGTLATVTFFSGLDEPRTQKFVEDFLALARERKLAEVLPPSQFDSASYDVVYLYAEALRQANATGDADKVEAERAAVRDALAGITGFAGIEGNLDVGPSGDVIKSVYIIEAQAGDWAFVDTAD